MIAKTPSRHRPSGGHVHDATSQRPRGDLSNLIILHHHTSLPPSPLPTFATMATATVTVSRALSTDTKHTVPANSPYNNLSSFRPIAQQYQANQHGNNPDLMGQDETSETSSHTASPSEAALPAGQFQLPAVQPAQSAQPTPAARPCGPVSAVRELPPRAKPGRKPMEHDHANDRRKVQNRQAQRNFRDKRAQKVDDLQRANAELTARLEEAERQTANEFHEQQQRINKLVIEKAALERKAASWERKYEEERKLRLATERDLANHRELHSHCGELHSQYVSKQMGFPNSIVQTAGRSMAMPPISNTMSTDMHHDHVNQDPDPYAEHEIDFNAEWSKGAFGKGPNTTTNGQVDWTDSSMDIDKAMGGNCGFCNIVNGSGPCPCREEAVSREPKPTLAPGGCDACIADPERAARCKALADRAEVSQRPNTRHDSIPQQTGYMSCSKLFDSTNLPLPSISELFRGDFHAYPPRNSAAGFDVNEHEVARVLQNLRNNGSAGGVPSSTE
jgi:hypothetical protein